MSEADTQFTLIRLTRDSLHIPTYSVYMHHFGECLNLHRILMASMKLFLVTPKSTPRLRLHKLSELPNGEGESWRK